MKESPGLSERVSWTSYVYYERVSWTLAERVSLKESPGLIIVDVKWIGNAHIDDVMPCINYVFRGEGGC